MENATKRLLFSITYGILFVLCINYLHSLNAIFETKTTGEELSLVFSAGWYWLLVPIISALMYKIVLPFWDRRYLPSLIIAGIVSFLTVFTAALEAVSSPQVLALSGFCLVMTILSIICLSFLVLSLFITGFKVLSAKPHTYKTRQAAFWNKKYALLLVACIILACWLIYLVNLWPGTTSVDFRLQLSQIQGTETLSDHHPLFTTWMLAGLYTAINSWCNSEQVASAVFVCLQTIAMLALFVCILHNMQKHDAAPSMLSATAIFFAANPIFPLFCAWIDKDTLSSIVLAFFFVAFVLLMFFDSTWRRFVAFVFVGISAGLMRHNYYYVVLAAGLIYFFMHVKAKPVFSITSTLLFALATPLLTAVFITTSGATPGSPIEALSIPFQQTARYARDARDDITPQEREIITNTLTTPERLSWLYAMNSSDAVKMQSTGDIDYGAYFKVWAAQGLRHPDIYLTAFLAQISGYWTIDSQDYRYYSFPELKTNGAFSSYLQNIQYFWPTKLFIRPGLYTWLLCFLFAYCIWQDKLRASILLIPAFVLLLTCMASPMAGSVRYMFALYLSIPLFIWCIKKAAISAATK